MKMNKTSKIVCAAAILVAGFTHCGAFAQQTTQTQSDTATLTTNINPYIGVFYAYAKMTNSNNGTFNVQPPTNTSTGTFKDASGFSAPYVSALVVTRKSDGYSWHTNNNNSLTFPATNAIYYTLTMYVNSSLPPPTNGQAMTLQVQWNTNSP